MKNRIYVLTIMSLFLLGVTAAWAGSYTIPNSFTSGTAAVAAEVNANFSAAKTAIDDNDSRTTALENSTVENGGATPVEILWGRVVFDMLAANTAAQISTNLSTLNPSEDYIIVATIVDEISPIEPEDLNVQLDFGDRTFSPSLIVRKLDGTAFSGGLAGETLTVNWIAIHSLTGTPLSTTIKPLNTSRPEDY